MDAGGKEILLRFEILEEQIGRASPQLKVLTGSSIGIVRSPLRMFLTFSNRKIQKDFVLRGE